MNEDHDHARRSPAPHRHPPRPDHDDTLTRHRAMEIALRELLIEKGVFTADDVRRQVEDMDSRTPAQGARVVAKAWSDPAFKKAAADRRRRGLRRRRTRARPI